MNNNLFEPDGAVVAVKCLTTACRKVGVTPGASYDLLSRFVMEIALDDFFMSGQLAEEDEKSFQAHSDEYYKKVNAFFASLADGASFD
jgi:hypothetical protein